MQKDYRQPQLFKSIVLEALGKQAFQIRKDKELSSKNTE